MKQYAYFHTNFQTGEEQCRTIAEMPCPNCKQPIRFVAEPPIRDQEKLIEALEDKMRRLSRHIHLLENALQLKEPEWHGENNLTAEGARKMGLPLMERENWNDSV